LSERERCGQIALHIPWLGQREVIRTGITLFCVFGSETVGTLTDSFIPSIGGRSNNNNNNNNKNNNNIYFHNQTELTSFGNPAYTLKLFEIIPDKNF
jgi:hypothetical protein